MKTFLAAHWDGLAAADFFTVEVLTLRGFVRYVVFFVMELKTRTVEIAGITSEPDGAWMTQLARNLTDPSAGFVRGVQYFILDRNPLYTAAVRRLLRDSRVKPPVLPAWSPNLNACPEGFVESAKSELYWLWCCSSHGRPVGVAKDSVDSGGVVPGAELPPRSWRVLSTNRAPEG